MLSAGFGLGIDYGTSNTVALMRWPDGRVKPLLFEGSPLLPSAVFAPADGGLVVGRDALHHARFAPARLEPNPKQHIDDERVLLGDREVPLVDMVAATLRHVAEEATRVAGGAIPQVALAHPAGWGPVRRTVLVDAARAAGLGDVSLVPEPTAAAQYYTNVLEEELPVGRPLVVYDLGGGTFDGSVVVRREHGIEVLAVDGNNDVGGLDIDALLVNWLGRTVGAQHPAAWARLASPVATADQQHRRMLWDDVRAAKEMLSRAPAVLIQLPLMDIEAQLTRDEFEAAVEPLLARTVRTTTSLIRYTQSETTDLAGILLVGGSSRIPLVATLLHRATGIAPIVAEQPELIVAEGTLQSIEPQATVVPSTNPATPAPPTPRAASNPPVIGRAAVLPPPRPATPTLVHPAATSSDHPAGPISPAGPHDPPPGTAYPEAIRPPVERGWPTEEQRVVPVWTPVDEQPPTGKPNDTRRAANTGSGDPRGLVGTERIGGDRRGSRRARVEIAAAIAVLVVSLLAGGVAWSLRHPPDPGKDTSAGSGQPTPSPSANTPAPSPSPNVSTGRGNTRPPGQKTTPPTTPSSSSPSEPPPCEDKVVPHVSLKTVDEATAALREAGFTNAPTIAKGTALRKQYDGLVVGVSPNVGSCVPGDTKITLYKGEYGQAFPGTTGPVIKATP